MTYKFWRNATLAALTLGTLGTAGYALAADTSTQQDLSNPTGWARAVKNGLGKKIGLHRNMEATDRTAIQDAIAKRDYEAWKKLEIANNPASPMLKTVTAENFPKFADMHDAMKAGDTVKAEALRKELGLTEFGMGQAKGKGMGMSGKRGGFDQTMFDAVLKGDFAAWKKLMEAKNPNSPALKVVTADNFTKFVAMHEAMKAGDTEKAEALRKELGLPEHGMGQGKGQGKGQGQGQGMGRGMHRQ